MTMIKKYFLTLSFLLGLTIHGKSQTIITFYTNMGSFEVALYDSLMPITTNNIKTLVNDKYYDGVIFHRIISNFVVQGGDPTGTGTGGPGYAIPDEFDSTLSNVVKTLSMANSGPNTGGSQFFINLKNNTFLDFDKSPLTSAHPVFGIVISGWGTVEMMEAVSVDGSNRPIVDVVMDSVRVTQIPLGMKALNLAENTLKIYPNPVNEESVFEIESATSELAEFALYNQNGVLIKSSVQYLGKGVNQIAMSDLGAFHLSTGLYVIKLTVNGKVQSKRFVVGD